MAPRLAQWLRDPLNQLQTKTIVHSAVTDSTVSTVAEGAVDSDAHTGYFLLFLFYNIFHLDAHYVCMLVQHFELQGRRFTKFHYY